MKRSTIFLMGLLVIITGMGVWIWWKSRVHIPDEPDQVIVISVDGTGEERGYPKEFERLHDCVVLGKVEITDPDQRRAVIAAVKEDIRIGHHLQAKCFFPRHVVRIVNGSRVEDIVICFQCHNYDVYRNNASRHGSTPSIGDSSKPLLNKILTDAGVPLAP